MTARFGSHQHGRVSLNRQVDGRIVFAQVSFEQLEGFHRHDGRRARSVP